MENLGNVEDDGGEYDWSEVGGEDGALTVSDKDLLSREMSI